MQHAAPDSTLARGLRIDVRGLTKTVGDGHRVLDDVSFTIEPGELVAIVGGSGAGKTTLLEAMAAIRPADEGSVAFDGVDSASHLTDLRRSMGYVPQDDIIHVELPLLSTLQYAAQLRLPSTTPTDTLHHLVEDALERLDLGRQRDLRVGALSGGQRKRASIAVELLTEPHVLFLDEPTSGLDPATSAGLLANLRRLADSGATIVLTTHAVQDLTSCNRVLFLASGGRLAFAGSVAEALGYFDVASVEDIYVTLSQGDPAAWAARWRRVRGWRADHPRESFHRTRVDAPGAPRARCGSSPCSRAEPQTRCSAIG